MRPNLARAVGILAGLLAVAGARADVIRFGAILPLTGSDAQIGTQEMHGIQFAVDSVNAAGGVRGNKIEILFEDGRADAQSSITAFDELANARKVPVIFTASAAASLALAPLATEKKILLVNADSQDDRLATASPYLINTLPTIREEVKALSRYLIRTGKKRGTILFENSPDGAAERDDFEKYFCEAGGTVLAIEPAPIGQMDYRPSLLKLAYAQPDVAMVAVSNGLVSLARQHKRLGLDFAIAATTLVADADVIADPSIDGLLHTQIHSDSAPEFAAEFKARFETTMAFPVRQYYDATQIALTVADRLLAEGRKLTGESMRATLFAIGKFRGLTSLDFTTNTATVPIEIRMIHDGRDVTVEQLTVEP